MKIVIRDQGMTPYWKQKVRQINKLCPVCGKSVPILVVGKYHPKCKEKLRKESEQKRKLCGKFKRLSGAKKVS